MNEAQEPQGKLEALLAEALEVADRDGIPALERFLDRHADTAPQLREALADLREADLLANDDAPMPEQLGEFRIKGELGSGGMGVVYLAEQSSLGREVALKVVRPELLLFEGARERFRREIDAVARLEHPAIVPILATGNCDGVPYYAMPRLVGFSGDAVVARLRDRDPATLSGADLQRALVDDGAESKGVDDTFAGSWWHAVVRLVRKAALGIHHAHTRGILHRDLKPSNLMLSADGRAIVLDFGLAQGRGSSTLTRTGSAAGSPAYMSPEQVRGEPADERTDVYGLAATLSCLLALRAPFAATSQEALRGEILAGARLDLRQRAGIPPELAIVIECAMDVDRARRHGSAQAFADDLQAVLDGTPIHARRLPWPVRARRFAQRHRSLSGAVAVALVFLLLTPALFWWQETRANESLQRQIDRSDKSVKLSIDAVEELLARVAGDRLRNVPATKEIALELTLDAIGLFDQLAHEEKYRRRVEWHRIVAWSEVARIQETLGRLDEAEKVALRILDLTERFLADGPMAYASHIRGQSYAALASHRIRRGEHESARDAIDKARPNYEVALADPKVHNHATASLGELETWVSEIAVAEGDFAAAEAALRRGEKLTGSVRGSHTANVMHDVMRLNLARFLRRRGRFDECIELAEAVIADYPGELETEVGWPTPRVIRARAIEERFLALYHAKRDEQALPAGREAIAALDDVLRHYPDAAIERRRRGACAGNLALILVRQRDYPRAEAFARDAIGYLRRLVADNPDDERALMFLASQYKTLTWLLRTTGQWSELENAAREFGALDVPPADLQRAARELLKCAVNADGRRADALLADAMELMLMARRAGAAIEPGDGRYAQLRGLPGWADLVGK